MSAATDHTPPTFGPAGIVDPDDVLDGPSRGHLPDAELAEPDLSPAPRLTGLDALRAELAEEVEIVELVLDVPTRPGYAVAYLGDVSYDELVAWRKRSAGKGGEVDQLRLAALVCANKCAGIRRQGQPVELDGGPLTFGSPYLFDLFSVTRATDAVRRFYGLDGHVAAAANAVLAASGFGDELAEWADDDMDPTRRATRS